MSNLPPNPYNIAGPPSLDAGAAPQVNKGPPYGQLPPGQLPPGFGAVKRDTTSGSPHPLPSNSAVGQVNNFHSSGNNSPAFNYPGIMPPSIVQSSLPMRPPIKPPIVSASHQPPLPPLSAPLATSSPRPVSYANSTLMQYPPNYQPKHINDTAPPLVPSSQNQPLVNRPPMFGPGPTSQPNQPPSASSAFAPPPISRPPMTSANFGQGLPPMSQPGISQAPAPMEPPHYSQSNIPFSGQPRKNSPSPGNAMSGPVIGPPMSRPSISGPPLSGPPISSPPMSGPPISSPQILGPPISNSFILGPQTNSQPMSAPLLTNGPPMGPPRSMGINGPSGSPISVAGMGPPRGPGALPPPPVSAPSYLPPGSQSYPGQQINGSSGPPGPSGPMGPSSLPTGLMGPPKIPGPPTSQPIISQPAMRIQPPPIGMNQPTSGSNQPPIGFNQPTIGQQVGPIGPPTGPPSGPPIGPMGASVSNMQGRYPQMPQGNYINQQPQPMIQQANQYPGPGGYGKSLDQQMSQLSVTKQGFDQLWGHQMIDLLTTRQILPEYPEDPPEIRLGQQFTDAPNCSHEIFRCTINRMPDTNNLLQKSRLPLGILIHPFKDLNHLPVIQCTTIVRCRACRTYINPFVYFVDAKRWKCNLCYRVNDLPEEFQYDPVSKSYGDPSRRPEIKSATIEFIAPGEYMLRPPQPAVYLFLLDVSQIARESGYLQVVCDTLKANLEQLPGDARTQVGFICFDSHVHYYLMSDGLTRPKEMTVLDIDDVFLPSPEDLLVNLRERGALVRELLSMLPARHSGPGVPSSALGAALQAAYKLMAPTGGRVTVFQTCLPNVGPGALQSREDPNTRSSSEVAHLNPATDFYKRIALDCSGAQVAVDLFLLNSQYSDLATLSGMSKFSAGTIYHIPLFRASRSWQVDQLTRILQRYLTRKIGFEAVMRIRCTRGIAIHTFHGNFFVRSTDLLSLPNVSPDAGFGMQLAIEESLSDLQQVCFQAALLYTSSKGERRIRVHTLALPVTSSLTDVLHSADQQCIIGLLAKMAVERSLTATLQEAREALMTVAVDALSAFKLAQQLPSSPSVNTLHAPYALRLLPLYLLAMLKRRAFRVGQSTRLDDRVADMCDMKTLPLSQLLRAVYPDLYPVHALGEHMPRAEEDDAPDPPRLHLTAERINSNGAYLLDDGDTMIVYICHSVSAAFLSDVWGVCAFSQVVDEARTIPKIDTEGNVLLHAFIDKLNDDRPYASNILVLRDNSPNRQLFTERLIDDRVESAFSHYEFLQHIKAQVK